MFDRFKKLLGLGRPSLEEGDRAELDRLVERAVETTDPRMRIISGYQRKLQPNIVRSLNYLLQEMHRLEGPATLSREAFHRDPGIRALFGTPAEIRELLSCSYDLEAFLKKAPASQEFLALLGMDVEEKRIFGVGMQGDIVRRDVARTAVNFSNHRLVFPTLNITELYRQLAERGMEHLFQAGLRRMAAMRSEAAAEVKDRVFLHAKLASLESAGGALGHLMGTMQVNARKRAQLEAERAKAERALSDMNSRQTTIEDYFAELVDALNSPEEHLHFRPWEVRVDRMGLKTEGEAGDLVKLTQIETATGASGVFLLVRVPRDEVGSPDEFKIPIA